MKKNDLRDQIKSQIQDEIKSKLSTESSDSLENLFELESERKRIFLEERDNYYRNQKGFIKITNEIGEEEWIREEDLKKREGYFNFEDDLEDADSHKSQVIRNLVVYTGIILVISCIAAYFFMESSGYVEVSCNLKGVTILLDGQPTGLLTDNVIENVQAGKHTISLKGSGIRVNPQSIDIEVRHNSSATAVFTADSLKRAEITTPEIPALPDSAVKTEPIKTK